MRVIRSLKQVPPGLRSVVTIGIFDGLHNGHQRLLRQVVRCARERGVEAWAITFDPHPATLHAPEKGVRLINTLEDRLDGMERLGLDGVLVEPYNWELASLTPEQFTSQYFVNGMGATAVVVGRDVKFGRNNSGDLRTLRELGERLGFDVYVLEDQTDVGGRRYSSTLVRGALARGDVQGAERILGRPHRVHGKVVHGFKRGRALGFPTANLDAEQAGEVPADGVYAGWLMVEGKRLPAAISVGTNPHFDGHVRTIEAHVLGRSDLNLYGQDVSVEFVKMLRPMRSFDSLEQLLEQMDRDLLYTAQALNVQPAGRVDPSAVTAQ